MKHIIKFLVCIIFFGSVDQLFGYMPNQVEAVKKALQTPGLKINCSGCDFRGVQDFAGLDMQGVFMPSVTMQSCMISDNNKNSMMICIEKQATNLTGTNLSHAFLFSSCLDEVVFDKADLTGADLSYSSVQYASLQGAIVKDIVTTYATFCHSIMPDGVECKDSWTGQGVTINCNCSDGKVAEPIPAPEQVEQSIEKEALVPVEPSIEKEVPESVEPLIEKEVLPVTPNQ